MILITGGFGYLGGRIAKYLLDSGEQVRVASRKIKSEAELKKLHGCEFVTIDLLDYDSLKDACHGVKSIIHLGAMNAEESAENPDEALIVNGLGTLKLIRSAVRENVKNFLYFSTVHIYGSPLKGTISETTLPRPLHSYSITHRIAEDYVIQANKNNLITGIVFRVSNAVGAPLFKNTNCWYLVVNNLCKQLIINNEMTLNSNSSIQRDYVPISMICRVVHQFIVGKCDTKDEGNVFNISSGVSMRLDELTQLISDLAFELFGNKPIVRFLDKSNKEMPDLSISNSKLKINKCPVNTDISSEIKTLLVSCDKWFGCNDEK
jgi:UDP-glucose 4-epimerase